MSLALPLMLQESDVQVAMASTEFTPQSTRTPRTTSSETVTSQKPLKDLVGTVSSVGTRYSNLNELFDLCYPTKKYPRATPWAGGVLMNTAEPSMLYRGARDAFDEAYTNYGRVAHMGVLDLSYHIFTSHHGYGATIYRIRHRTAVVTGDPLCSADDFGSLMHEFFQFSSERKLLVAFMGVSEVFANYAKEHNWATILFGRERVLNPQTNMVLLQQAGKRIMTQNRRLLDPDRVDLTMRIYGLSSSVYNPKLEATLQNIYDEWREDRNSQVSGHPQAFITVFSLFSCPDMTIFVYATDSSDNVLGFAGLRSIGAVDGFHLDPCVATPEAPAGTTEPLITMTMLLLRDAGVAHLSLGFEPLSELGDISGQPNVQTSITRWGYRQIIRSLPVNGKAAYNDKFRPDEAVAGKLYIVVPGMAWPLRQSAALTHIANIKVGRLLSVKVNEMILGVPGRRRKEPQKENLKERSV